MTDDIDDSVRLAADCLVATEGVEGAIADLQARVDAASEADSGRALAALAYLRREVLHR